MTFQNNSSWSSWAVNTLVKSPLSWSVGRIKESIVAPTTVVDEKSEYIILNLVEVKPFVGNVLFTRYFYT